ncbi:MAG TPA: alpha/beta hydrolase [Actinophytocola sp.]|uniref:alpha/beta fold hydrolase n=1 Tax=Actinophytocola sp. TaxID=1872138 RepID=UPI002DBC6ECA|nr:alpha/beta hydrolase [Actinophytocola sp.]HEU5473667.1 alpha/beta hydrolase [Actinophytocola sp.]
MPTFASYDGTVLCYHRKGDGPPLVCVPGGPGRASAYLEDLGGLSAHRELILLDHRGTGESAVPAEADSYRAIRLVDDVEALRVHLGLDRLDLLGHSAGGNVVTLYAARHPDRVARLVLVAPGWLATGLDFTDAEWLAVLHSRADQPWYPEAYAAMMRREAGEETPANRVSSAPFFFFRWTAAARHFAESEQAQVSPEARAGFRADGAFGDPVGTRAALRRVGAPVLLLGGDIDPAPTPRLLQEFAALFPDATVVIQPRTGHIPWIDDADLFVDTVTAFLGPG